MRLLSVLALLPLPAAAWEFSPDPICTLSHGTADAEIVITFDATRPEYMLSITLLNGTWRDADGFRMVFGGGREIDIGTNLHQLSQDRATLTVTDRGFGNVLNGLEYNDSVVSTSGATHVIASLSDVGPALSAFRACPSGPPPTS